MAEFDDEKLSLPEDIGGLDLSQQLEEEDHVKEIINNLLSGIDLPGDEVKRQQFENFLKTGGISYDDHEPKEEEHDRLGEGVYYKPAAPVEFKAPELKSERRKRITADDVNQLLKDVNRVDAGGKLSTPEPIFGKELEPEKKVADLEELQNQKWQETAKTSEPIFEQEKEKGFAMLDDSERKKPLNFDEELLEPLAEETKELPDLDIPEDMDHLEDIHFDEEPDAGLADEKETLFPEMETPRDEDMDHLGDFSFDEELEPKEKKLEPVLSAEEDMDHLGDIDFSKELDEAKAEKAQPFLEESEEPITLDDLDEKISDEPLFVDEKGFDDIVSEKKGFKSEFDDIEPEEVPLVVAKKEQPAFVRPEELVIEHPEVEQVESEFGDLTSLGRESIPEHEKYTLKELEEGPEQAIVSQFHQLPEMEEIKEEVEPIRAVAPEVKPRETKREEVAAFKPKEDFKELDEMADFPAFEEPKPIPQVYVAPTPQPSYEEHEDLDFTEEQLAAIQRSLQALPMPLSKIATDVIVDEKLPVKDLKYLTNKLIQDPNPNEIKSFLEDRLHIAIPMAQPKQQPVRPAERREKRKPIIPAPLAKALVAAVFIIAALASYILLVYIPNKHKEDHYLAGLRAIDKNNYPLAEDEYKKAKEESEGDVSWMNQYADRYLNTGDPNALPYAYKKLISDKEKNEKGSRELDKENSDTYFLIAKYYLQKADWEAYNKDFDAMKSSFLEAIDQGYKGNNPLYKKDPSNEKVLDGLGETYIQWGKNLSSDKRNDRQLEAIEKYKDAEENYKQALEKNEKSPVGLYGLLNTYLSKRKTMPDFQPENMNNLIEQTYRKIELADLSKINERSLTAYAAYLLEKKGSDPKKAKEILDKVLQKEEGKIYPEVFYYLGQYYQSRGDDEKGVECYQKGLLSYYMKQIGEKQFNKDVNVSDSMQQAKKFEFHINEALNFVMKDKRRDDSQLQSQLFNKLGEIYAKKSGKLRETLLEEKKEKETLLLAAKQNFNRSLEKNPSNSKTWQNLGDLAYTESVSKGTDFSKAKNYYLNSLTTLYAINGNIDPKTFISDETALWKYLPKGIDEVKKDPELYYKLGYIFYNEKKYESSAVIFEAIKTAVDQKFNPSLNFALGNAYLRSRDYGMAASSYEKVVEGYEQSAARYSQRPEPSNLRQNEVFAKLANAHNNWGVARHLQSEQTNETKQKEEARLHYYKAREYASKLNNEVVPAEATLGLEKLNENINFLVHDRINLANRTVVDAEGKKVRLDPLSYMLVDYLEPFLKLSKEKNS